MAVTYRCQARCAHCSSASLANHRLERRRLRLDEIRRLAADGRALGIYEVNFTGGEPTLRADLEEVVRAIQPEGLFVGLNTNADLLDSARIRSLRDAGVDMLKISLDSSDGSAHDSNRGLPGNFERVVEVLELVRTLRGIRGHICTVATSEAIRSGDAGRLLDLAVSRDATIGFVLPVAVGRWSHRHEVELPAEDLRRLRLICKHPSAFFQGSSGLADFRCPAGRQDLYVTPWGDVLPCPFVQRSYGSLRQHSLGVLFDRVAEAAALAGDGSLCLAADSIKWARSQVPESAVRLDLPGCAADHEQSFCKRPTAAREPPTG